VKRILLDKLIVAQIIKKFHMFYGMQRLVMVFARAHLFLIS